jgi:hypothetical protein
MVMPPATASKRSYNDNRTSTEEPHVSIMLAAHYCLRRSSLDRCNALIETFGCVHVGVGRKNKNARPEDLN